MENNGRLRKGLCLVLALLMMATLIPAFATPIEADAMSWRTLTFELEGGGRWRTAIPSGWTRDGDTLTRTVPPGTNWNTIQWPTASNVQKDGHVPIIPERPTGTVPTAGGTVNFVVTWTPIMRTLTFNTGTGGTWDARRLPWGWTLVSDTQITTTVAAGTYWEFVPWPGDRSAFRESFGAIVPDPPTGRVPATGGTVNFTLSWMRDPVTVFLTLNPAAGWTSVPRGWNGGGEPGRITRIYRTQSAGSPVTWPANPTSSTHTFRGWTVAGRDYMPRPSRWPRIGEEVSFYGQWTPNQITVTLHADTGGAWASAPEGWTAHAGTAPNITQIRRTQDAGSCVEWPEDPTRDNRTLTSWSPARPETWPTAARTYRAQWTQDTRTVTFELVGGGRWRTAIPSGWTRVGDTQITRNVPVGANWSTISWPTAANVQKDNHVPIISERPVGIVPATGGILDFTVTWMPIMRTITFNAGTGATWDERFLPRGWTLVSDTRIATEVAAGTRWDAIVWPVSRDIYRTSFDPVIPRQPTGTVPRTGGTVNFTVTWVGQPVRVFLTTDAAVSAWERVPSGWNIGGGEPGRITRIYRTQVAGSSVTWPANPTSRTHTLVSWTVAGYGDNTPRPRTWPCVNYSSLMADWTPNQITVTLHAGTGGAWTSLPEGWTAHMGTAPNITQIRRTQDAGSDVDWPEDPTRANRTLTSWSPVRPTTWPISRTTYRAQW